MICESRLVPSVVTTSAWVSPRVNSAEPWVRGSTPTLTLIGRTVSASRPSIRGSPFRMRWRTMLLSSLKSCISTCPAGHFGVSAGAQGSQDLCLDLAQRGYAAAISP